MHAVRRWSVRHARGMMHIYNAFESVLLRLHPVFEKIGYARLERPVAAIERPLKAFLFDCQMCGQCVLSKTGMSCPMNCPKGLRNGPCGGVRADGNCEVRPEMRCVWVEAWAGAQHMAAGAKDTTSIQLVLPPVDHSLAGHSSWLRVVRDLAAEAKGEAAAPETAKPGA